MYKHNYEVDYLYIEEDLTTSFTRLVYYIQETSLHHSNSIGLPMEWFYQEMKGFVLTSWNFKLYKLPKWGEKIVVTTYPTRFKEMLADRAFAVYNEAGEKLMDAQSNWIYMNLKTMQPERVSTEMFELFKPLGDVILTKRIKLPKKEEGELFRRTTYLTALSDIDSNHHVNNVRYITLALNNLKLKSEQIDEVSVKYASQTKCDELLTITSYDTDKGYLVEIHKEDELRCSVLVKLK